MSKAIELHLPYPLSVNRYWRNFRGHTVLSKKGREFKQEVAALGLLSKVKIINEPVRVSMLILPKRTRKGAAYQRVIDVDNGLKCVLDSLQGVAYIDDNQVKSLRVDYGEPVPNGGCIVWVERLEYYGND